METRTRHLAQILDRILVGALLLLILVLIGVQASRATQAPGTATLLGSTPPAASAP